MNADKRTMNADKRYTIALVLLFAAGIFLGQWAMRTEIQEEANHFIPNKWLANPRLIACLQRLNETGNIPLPYFNETVNITPYKFNLLKTQD